MASKHLDNIEQLDLIRYLEIAAKQQERQLEKLQDEYGPEMSKPASAKLAKLKMTIQQVKAETK